MDINKNIEDEISKLIDKINKNNIVEDEKIGFDLIESEQYKNFILFDKLVSEEKLISLTNDYRPVIRCYAFLALKKRGYENLLKIIVKHLNDNEEITYSSGCRTAKYKVGDFYIAFANITKKEKIDLYRKIAENDKITLKIKDEAVKIIGLLDNKKNDN